MKRDLGSRHLWYLRFIRRGGVLVVLGGASTLGGGERHGDSGPDAAGTGLMLNQNWIEQRWGGSVADERNVRAVHPARSDNGAPDRSGVVFEDSRSIFQFVLEHLPEENLVLPSERYFYFQFPLGSRRVSGNLRFVDAALRLVHMGYFDQDDRFVVHTATWSEAEGVGVDYDAGSGTVEVRSRNVERRFVLDRRWDCWPARLALQEGEEFISGVLDESGFFFSLLFHHPTSSFYYVLNEDLPRSETLWPMDPPYQSYWIGPESRFVFYHDPATDRKVLVAVSADEIRRNSYFDGPFDQVPPFLDIGHLVERSYPYVRFRGGVDRHGNFIGVEGQRIAISPYQNDETVTELLPLLELMRVRVGAAGSPWLGMVREDKRDFVPARAMLDVPEDAATHVTARSASWPANHWRSSSDAWPSEHRARTSLRWPPQHEARLSIGTGTDSQ